MRYLRKFNEANENDPTLERFMAIVKKHFDESDVEYLGTNYNAYESINSTLSETFEEMKRRLGPEYSDYIWEGILGQKLEDIIEDLEAKVFIINGHAFKVSDNLSQTEHNLGRFKEQLSFEDEDENFIESLDWKYFDLPRGDESKLYSKWDFTY